MKTDKSERREKARHKSRYGHKVGSKSVFVIIEQLVKRKKRKRKEADDTHG